MPTWQLGRDRGGPNQGSTLLRKRVVARIRSRARTKLATSVFSAVVSLTGVGSRLPVPGCRSSSVVRARLRVLLTDSTLAVACAFGVHGIGQSERMTGAPST
jgi:hypothetical protein